MLGLHPRRKGFSDRLPRLSNTCQGIQRRLGPSWWPQIQDPEAINCKSFGEAQDLSPNLAPMGRAVVLETLERLDR